MTITEVSSKTFLADTVNLIRNKIKANITDPIVSIRPANERFCMTSYPKRVVQYPIITVKQVNIITSKLGMASEVHDATISLEVRIWAKDSKQCDTLTGSVIDVLRDNQYSLAGTDNEEIFGFNITSGNSIVEGEGDNTIHSKILGIEYRAILT